MEIEQQHSNTEKNLFAVVYALKWLNNFTYGYTVQVETDHKPLMSILKKSIAASSPRLQWLLLRLPQYDVHIKY